MYTVLEIARIWNWALSEIFFISYTDRKSFWQHFDISSSFWYIANFPKDSFNFRACTGRYMLLKSIVMDSPDFCRLPVYTCIEFILKRLTFSHPHPPVSAPYSELTCLESKIRHLTMDVDHISENHFLPPASMNDCLSCFVYTHILTYTH